MTSDTPTEKHCNLYIAKILLIEIAFQIELTVQCMQMSGGVVGQMVGGSYRKQLNRR